MVTLPEGVTSLSSTPELHYIKSRVGRTEYVDDGFKWNIVRKNKDMKSQMFHDFGEKVSIIFFIFPYVSLLLLMFPYFSLFFLIFPYIAS